MFGFRVIMSTLLTKNSVQRDCYAIHKDSVGLALAQDITTRIDYVAQKASHLVLGTMSGGSTVIDADGVVKVEVTENTLTVSASSSDKEDDSFVHKGIAKRAFKRQWTLAEHLEVKDAQLKDGVLTVDMKLNLPEEKKPRTIKIK